MTDFIIHTFPNGLRMAYKQVASTRIAHCGFTVDAGSRDEAENELGLAHLIEHMLFKGTRKRGGNQVINRLEVVGGDLNAFTSKDKTCVYASIVDVHVDRAIELITDITFHSVFPEKELEKEKKVIADEIDMYLDTPEERIFDEFQEFFYGKDPLGTNILGTKESLSAFRSNDLIRFRNHHYTARNTVFSFVGRMALPKLIRICEKYFGSIPIGIDLVPRKTFAGYNTFHKTQKMPFLQAHVLTGGTAYKLTDPLRPGLMLLSNIIGGPGLNSLLNLSLREKHGFTYGVESSYQSFADTGLFNIYWSTDAKNLNKSISIVNKELQYLMRKPMSEYKLNKYKTQFKGQLIMAEEGKTGLMLMMGRSLIDLGKIDGLEEVLKTIEGIGPEMLREIANEVLTMLSRSWLIYEPNN